MGHLDMDGGQPRAEWGLRCYVQRVAHGLGVGLESVCCEAAEPANAYLALTQRPLRDPDRDVALVWDPVHGWALGIEDGSGEALVVVAYLGSERLLADPEDVVVFAKTVLAGEHAGQANPPAPRCADLTGQLIDYARTDGTRR